MRKTYEEDIIKEDDIDFLIQEVTENLPEKVEEKETEPIEVPDVKTEDELIDLTIQKNLEVESKADLAFNMFFDNLSRNLDHTSSSKEQMLEALKVRVELNKTLVELAKLKKKRDAATGVFINTVSPGEAGINIRKIQDEINDGAFDSLQARDT